MNNDEEIMFKGESARGALINNNFPKGNESAQGALINKYRETYNKSNKTEVTGINSKQMSLLYSPNGLLNFYDNMENRNILYKLIKQQTVISLRLLDWLVTNYAKTYNVIYDLYTGEDLDADSPLSSNRINNVWMDYKNQLNSYSKKLFDPFARKQRIYYDISNNTVSTVYTYESKNIIETTVGQMNFFRWAISNKILYYAERNLKNIEKDMIQSTEKKSKLLKKRQMSKNNSCAKCQKQQVIIQFA